MKCHYEVLGVTQTANEDELKKAYRAQALKWHPDKNRDKLDEATTQFQLIQAAYACLSDPQERAWYDNHREAVLRGGTGLDEDEGIDLMPYFSPSVFSGFGDDAKGFYAVYAKIFKEISDDEIRAGEYLDDEEAREAPPFGDSNASYEKVVRLFYQYWENFVTKRPFHSCDKWDVREADGRRMKRAMEKENKKHRDARRKEYNLNVRELASYVKKRDRRVQAFMAKKREEAELAEQKLKDKRTKSAKSVRVNANASIDEAHLMGLDGIESQIDAIFGLDPDQQELEDGMFCPACGKAFKSAKQWENHKRSKKHLAAVAALKLDLEDEDQLVNAGGDDREEEEGEGEGDEEKDGSDATKSDAGEASAADDGAGEDGAGEAEAGEAGPGDGAKVAFDSNEGEASESEAPRRSARKPGRKPAPAARAAPAEPEPEQNTPAEQATSTHASDGAASDEDAALAAMMSRLGRKSNKAKAASKAEDEDEEEEELGKRDAKSKKKGRRKARNPYEHYDPYESDDGKKTKATAEAPTPAPAEEGDEQDAENADSASVTAQDGAPKKLKGKKAKEARKAQRAGQAPQQESLATEESLECSVCHMEFPTRNKLFQHISSTGHAVPLGILMWCTSHHTGTAAAAAAAAPVGGRKGKRS